MGVNGRLLSNEVTLAKSSILETESESMRRSKLRRRGASWEKSCRFNLLDEDGGEEGRPVRFRAPGG